MLGINEVTNKNDLSQRTNYKYNTFLNKFMQRNYWTCEASLHYADVWYRYEYYMSTSKYITGIKTIDDLWSDVPLE